LILRNNYAPYGEDAVSEGGANVRYKFTDKEKDQSGLYYFGARYYDPEVGRFISVDPAGSGVNWYTYCACNPVLYTDPTGLYEILDGQPGTSSEFSIVLDPNSESGYRVVHDGGNNSNSDSSDSTSSSWASTIGSWASSIGRGFLDCLGYSSYANGNKAFANGDYLNGVAYYVTGIGEECFTLWGLGELYAAKTAGKIGIGVVGSLGKSYGKFGTVVENPGIKITEFSKHGIDQAISRGVTPQALQNTMNNPITVLSQRGGSVYAYVSNQAVVVVDKAGKVITTYGSKYFDQTVTKVIKEAVTK
jgi:RHS repeat-associated protein